MRLIDADVLKTRNIMDMLEIADFDDEIESVIDSIPTAYDVEAKVAELKNIKTGGDCRQNCKHYDWSVGSCEGHCEDYVREKAISIVRGKE